MGEALFELEQILRSSPYKMTPVEENLLNKCKGMALRDFTLTSLVTSGVVWIATRKLGYGYRINLSGGAGIFSGMWRFDRSLNSSVDKILSFEGTRMQSELANILLTKHRDHPWTKQLIKKHFYPEQVYDDSSLEKPVSRWRHRNHYADSAAQPQSERTNDNVTNDTSTDMESKQITEPRQQRTNMEFKQLTETRQHPPQISSGLEVSEDPFDCLFGYSEKHEEINHSDSADISPKRRIRNRRRTLRRHRANQTEVSADNPLTD